MNNFFKFRDRNEERIFNLYRSGASIKEIATAFSCSDHIIARMVIRGKVSQPAPEFRDFDVEMIEHMIAWAGSDGIEIGEISEKMKSIFFNGNGDTPVGLNSKPMVVSAGIHKLILGIMTQLTDYQHKFETMSKDYAAAKIIQKPRYIERYEYQLLKQGLEPEVVALLISELDVNRLPTRIEHYGILVEQAIDAFKRAAALQDKHTRQMITVIDAPKKRIKKVRLYPIAV